MIPTSKLSTLFVAMSFLAACSTSTGGTTTTTTAGTTASSTSAGTSTGSGTTSGGPTSGTTTGTTTTGGGNTTTGGTTAAFMPTFEILDVNQALATNKFFLIDAGSALNVAPQLVATADGGNVGDVLTLMVELQPIDVPFSNAANIPNAGIPSTDTTVTATLPPLDAGSYHWQVQCTANSGGYTDWVPFNDGGLAFVICGSGTCPDSTGFVCAATDLPNDPHNCWVCGNSCTQAGTGWCDPNDPDGGDFGTIGLGCHTPQILTANLTSPVISAVSPSTSHCYYYAEALGVNSQSFQVPLAPADWYTLQPNEGQLPAAIAADPGGVALATNVAPNDAGLVNQVLYFPNDGGCGSGLNVELSNQPGATYHGIASDGTNVYVTVTVVLSDAGVTDDQVWKIPIATQTAQVLLLGQKSLSDIVYDPLNTKLYFLERTNPPKIYEMGSDGSSPNAIVPAAAEAFGPSPALALSLTVGTPGGTLYWTSATGVYDDVGSGNKVLTGINGPTGISTFLEGTAKTDAVFVTVGDGTVVEWHASDSSTSTLATNQSKPDYPQPYVQSCDAGSCIYQLTWLWEVNNGGGAWVAVDFNN